MVFKDAVIANLRAERKKLQDKLEAVQGWWNAHNQCIDSEAVKDKLEAILEDNQGIATTARKQT